MSTKTSHIVVIGGGTGAPLILKSLLQAGFTNLTAISASMDSGGRTGHIRTDERDRVISISDTLRCLLALIKDSDNHKSPVEAFMDLASFTDGRGRNVGYNIYYGLLEKYDNDFAKVQSHLEKLLDIKFHGTAIPSSTTPTHIHFSTQNGTIYHGEHELDRQSMSANPVTKFWISPLVKANPKAIKALKRATHIIYAPGSLYGSILSNFLPTGITSALKASPAKKILVTNLVSTRNQTHNYTPQDYLNIFKTYSKLKSPFNTIIIPNISQEEFDRQYPQVKSNYATEHSHFLGWNTNQLQPIKKLNIEVIQAPIFSITKTYNRLRHNPDKLSEIFTNILT